MVKGAGAGVNHELLSTGESSQKKKKSPITLTATIILSFLVAFPTITKPNGFVAEWFCCCQ